MHVQTTACLVASAGAAKEVVVQAQCNAPPTAPAPARTTRIHVLGSVQRPGSVELNDGDRLSTVLSRAGTETPANPDLSRVVLVRTDPATGKTSAYLIDVYQALRHGDQRYDPILRSDDRIYVPEVRPAVRPWQMAAP
jgi:protein involved in polysaccharide export with SLBB domain